MRGHFKRSSQSGRETCAWMDTWSLPSWVLGLGSWVLGFLDPGLVRRRSDYRCLEGVWANAWDPLEVAFEGRRGIWFGTCTISLSLSLCFFLCFFSLSLSLSLSIYIYTYIYIYNSSSSSSPEPLPQWGLKARPPPLLPPGANAHSPGQGKGQRLGEKTQHWPGGVPLWALYSPPPPPP